jgi:hypothetical protein
MQMQWRNNRNLKLGRHLISRFNVHSNFSKDKSNWNGHIAITRIKNDFLQSYVCINIYVSTYGILNVK